MSQMQVTLDMIMCFFWGLTYTLVLIGTVKYRFPLTSLITQLIIAPLEFAVTIDYVIKGISGFQYAAALYAYWSFMEILIIIYTVKIGCLTRKRLMIYIVFMITLTIIMFRFAVIDNQLLFYNYVNTFIGEIVWLFYFNNKKYPFKPIVLMFCITKFMADTFAIGVYYGMGTFIENAICILLPLLDFIFIVIYFQKKFEYNQD